MIIPDQLIDRTKRRIDTYFGDGVVGHILFTEPFCRMLSQIVYDSAKDIGTTTHQHGTCVVIEGPALSTKAESQSYRLIGADMVSMTMLPEAKLAREAEICYAAIGCVTDYDCQRLVCDETTMDAIVDIQHLNAQLIKDVIKLAVDKIPQQRNCSCANALKGAIETPPELIPDTQKQNLDLLLREYLDRNRP